MNVTDRFWSRVTKTNSCWWFAGTEQGEYGRFVVDSKKVPAHRFSYELHFGPITDGLFVCHRCDNRRCVRPDHLFLGTPKENSADCVRKGRAKPARGERHGGSKLKNEDIPLIQALISMGVRYADIAADFGISKATVCLISKGKRYGGAPIVNGHCVVLGQLVH